jgi:hypothetical protein
MRRSAIKTKIKQKKWVKLKSKKNPEEVKKKKIKQKKWDKKNQNKTEEVRKKTK